MYIPGIITARYAYIHFHKQTLQLKHFVSVKDYFALLLVIAPLLAALLLLIAHSL
jgi:hypothetical protein